MVKESTFLPDPSTSPYYTQYGGEWRRVGLSTNSAGSRGGGDQQERRSPVDRKELPFPLSSLITDIP